MNDLTSLLPAVLRKIQFDPEITEQLVLSLWKTAVGKTLAQKTQPTRLHQSTLVISVPSQTWKRELFALRFEILRKLEQILGKEWVTAVEFRVDPRMESRSNPPDNKAEMKVAELAALPLENVRDSELGRSLAAAAASYFNRPR
jgi:predicted nucleic acid-binding Zn ribbon protein